MKVQIYSDGAARGNPGPAGIGVVVKHGNKTIAEVAEYLGKTTNNIAEYLAFIRGLEEALACGAKEVECYADSELLVRQINGEYRVKNEGLVPLFHHAESLLKRFTHHKVIHIRREKNEEADRLSNQGIDDHQDSTHGPLFGKI